METDHLKTPFKMQLFDEAQVVILDAGDGTGKHNLVAIVSGENKKKTAEFIVRACNNHDTLVEALEELRSACLEGTVNDKGRYEILDQGYFDCAILKAYEAIQKVKGK